MADHPAVADVASRRQLYQQERPAGEQAARLFETIPGLLDQLNRIVEQVVTSAHQPDEARSITFLVSGDWGAGKSTALEYIEWAVRRATGPSRLLGGTVFTWYHAPLFENHDAGARATLLLEVVKTLSDHRRAEMRRRDQEPRPDDESYPDIATFLLNALEIEAFEPSADVDPEDRRGVALLNRTLRLSRHLTDEAVAGLALEHWLPRYHEETAAPRLTTVVLIEDLDRCNSSEFIKDVLVATRHWARATNHYFVIAADEARVRKALAGELPSADTAPDGGLGKYVHVRVRIPAEIPDISEGARMLFREWVDDAELKSENVRVRLRRQLEGGGGLLQPLLTGCSPRVLKERFNSLVAELGNTTDAADERLRTAVLRIRWPKAFETRLDPALLGEEPVALAWCRHLAALGRLVEESPPPGDRRSRAEMVATYAAASGLHLDGIDPELGLYLATIPLLTESLAVTPLPTVSRRPSAADGTAAPAPDLFTALSVLSRSLDVGAVDEMQAAYRDVAAVLEHRMAPANLAPLLGEVARRFAEHDEDFLVEALELYRWAAKAGETLDATLPYVRFVLDGGLAEEHELCRVVLDRVAPVADSVAGADRDRMLLLDLRLHQAQQLPLPAGELEALVAHAGMASEPWSAADLRELLRLAAREQQHELLVPITNQLLDSRREDLTARLSSLLLLAELLDGGTDAGGHDLATELYLFTLRSGLARRLDPQRRAGILTVLARRLMRRRSHGPAGWLLWHAHEIWQDDATRSWLAVCYQNLDRRDTADALRDGAEVPAVPPAQPPFRLEQLALGDRAAGLADRWFPAEVRGRPLLPDLWEDA